MSQTKKFTAWAFCLIAAVALSVSAAKAAPGGGGGTPTTSTTYSGQTGLHMGTGYGTRCATGVGDPDCTGGPNDETVIAKYGAISDIYYNPNSSDYLSPVYLIFGAAYGCTTSGPACIPAGSGQGGNAVSSVKYYEDYAANPGTPVDNYDYGSGTFMKDGSSAAISGDPFGLATTCNQGLGFWCGNFDLSTNGGKDVYELLGLPAGLEQNSLTLNNLVQNIMFAEPEITGITGFSLYAYQLTPNSPYQGLTGKGMIALTFAVPPPAGSFAAAFGCTINSPYDPNTHDNNTESHYDCQQVNRTNALIMPPTTSDVPEPGSLILLGTGLLGLGAKLKRKLMS